MNATYLWGQAGLFPLSSGDALKPGDFSGDGRDDLFINVGTRLAMLRTSVTILGYPIFERMYEYWIHNYNYFARWGHQ